MSDKCIEKSGIEIKFKRNVIFCYAFADYINKGKCQGVTPSFICPKFNTLKENIRDATIKK